MGEYRGCRTSHSARARAARNRTGWRSDQPLLSNAPFHPPHDAVRLPRGEAGDRVRARLRAGHRIAAKFIRIAGGAEVGYIAIGETDTDTIGVIDTADRAETRFRRKKLLQAMDMMFASVSGCGRELGQ